ncbi:fungal-specific transcription factor domain-containing protein [Pyrenochaeta sp. MPI-SDFR-AT-0127]|nr:fungal-specific transcription factor domain-containing protein [Pyrenochaeta sp. MPI-SDFR-AT-0127]
MGECVFDGHSSTSRVFSERWQRYFRLDSIWASADDAIEARDRTGKEQLVIPNILDEYMPSIQKMPTSDDMELLSYFETVVINILPMLGSNRKTIHRILLQTALSNRTKASRAVLLSLLALASYHRGDDLASAARMKYSALQALLKATGAEIDANAGIEHVIAGVLLCVVEMQQSPLGDCGWVGHICGAKEVIHVMQQKQHPPGSDTSVIFGWAYYFDVLTRFTLRHWRTESIKSTAEELGFSTNGSELCALQYIIMRDSFAKSIPTIEIHAHPVMQLLAEVFETILSSSNPHYHTTEYQQSLNNLTFRLENVSLVSEHGEEAQCDSASLELTRLAALVYLERVSRNFSGQSAKIGKWIIQAQAILIQLRECPSHFTLFIFGCEAHTDEDRLILLALFTRIEQRPYINSFLGLKGLIQSAWIQHDLEVDGSLEYVHKINLVLSSRNIIPNFM